MTSTPPTSRRTIRWPSSAGRELARSVLDRRRDRERHGGVAAVRRRGHHRSLNERFLDEEGPTDVLAFPIEDEADRGGRSPDEGGTGPGSMEAETGRLYLLGDVVICPSVAARNAVEHGATFDDEIALLVVHGILHLLGMDHQVDEEAERMEQREQQLLARYYRVAS